MLRGALCGHTDSVWGLVYSSAHQRLLSCSADGTVRLWDANTTAPALAVLNEDKSNQPPTVLSPPPLLLPPLANSTSPSPELGVPSSVDLVCSEPAHLVTSFTDGQIGLFNMETGQLVLSLESSSEPGEVHLKTVTVCYSFLDIDMKHVTEVLLLIILQLRGKKFFLRDSDQTSSGVSLRLTSVRLIVNSQQFIPIINKKCPQKKCRKSKLLFNKIKQSLIDIISRYVKFRYFLL